MSGEPLPVELANTTYAVRGKVRDGLADVGALSAWLELTLPGLPSPREADLTVARELRDAIRALAGAVVAGERPAEAAVEAVNKHARTAPRWRELRWDAPPSAVPYNTLGGVAGALSSIAQEAVDLFAGPLLDDLRACHAPGCVLFFVKDHPRREWCSAGCGNRARAARHYDKVRGA
ncbi:CGNR zinc finger domain-containing protein [Nonomuraea sp. NPDC050556]|uniref:CGNR zinc finger domain-containing protein n=1 Tax=Nonomuraea sp. NPDC050556 TaxID=3364369 RepID=UPI0037A552B7